MLLGFTEESSGIHILRFLVDGSELTLAGNVTKVSDTRPQYRSGWMCSFVHPYPHPQRSISHIVAASLCQLVCKVLTHMLYLTQRFKLGPLICKRLTACRQPAALDLMWAELSFAWLFWGSVNHEGWWFGGSSHRSWEWVSRALYDEIGQWHVRVAMEWKHIVMCLAAVYSWALNLSTVSSAKYVLFISHMWSWYAQHNAILWWEKTQKCENWALHHVTYSSSDMKDLIPAEIFIHRPNVIFGW